MVNKLHHELLISYCKDRLNKLPHGYYGTHRGHAVIYVTYDPMDKSVDPRNKRIIRLCTKQGEIYRELIEEADRVELALRSLQKKWNTTYKNNPRIFEYPLTKKEQPMISSEFFKQSSPNQNTRDNARDILYNGQYLRSKNELSVCQLLERMGYEYKVEIALYNPVSNRFEPEFTPDVTFLIPELDVAVSMEIDGAMEQDGYHDKSEFRKHNYFKRGYIEFRDILFYRLNDPYSLDISRAEALINAAILTNLQNIVI